MNACENEIIRQQQHKGSELIYKAYIEFTLEKRDGRVDYTVPDANVDRWEDGWDNGWVYRTARILSPHNEVRFPYNVKRIRDNKIMLA